VKQKTIREKPGEKIIYQEGVATLILRGSVRKRRAGERVQNSGCDSENPPKEASTKETPQHGAGKDAYAFGLYHPQEERDEKF